MAVHSNMEMPGAAPSPGCRSPFSFGSPDDAEPPTAPFPRIAVASDEKPQADGTFDVLYAGRRRVNGLPVWATGTKRLYSFCEEGQVSSSFPSESPSTPGRSPSTPLTPARGAPPSTADNGPAPDASLMDPNAPAHFLNGRWAVAVGSDAPFTGKRCIVSAHPHNGCAPHAVEGWLAWDTAASGWREAPDTAVAAAEDIFSPEASPARLAAAALSEAEAETVAPPPPFGRSHRETHLMGVAAAAAAADAAAAGDDGAGEEDASETDGGNSPRGLLLRGREKEAGSGSGKRERIVTSEILGYQCTEGLKVVRVVPKSPAARAGLAVKDTLVWARNAQGKMVMLDFEAQLLALARTQRYVDVGYIPGHDRGARAVCSIQVPFVPFSDSPAFGATSPARAPKSWAALSGHLPVEEDTVSKVRRRKLFNLLDTAAAGTVGVQDLLSPAAWGALKKATGSPPRSADASASAAKSSTSLLLSTLHLDAVPEDAVVVAYKATLSGLGLSRGEYRGVFTDAFRDEWEPCSPKSWLGNKDSFHIPPHKRRKAASAAAALAEAEAAKAGGGGGGGGGGAHSPGPKVPEKMRSRSPSPPVGDEEEESGGNGRLDLPCFRVFLEVFRRVLVMFDIFGTDIGEGAPGVAAAPCSRIRQSSFARIVPSLIEWGAPSLDAAACPVWRRRSCTSSPTSGERFGSLRDLIDWAVQQGVSLYSARPEARHAEQQLARRASRSQSPAARRGGVASRSPQAGGRRSVSLSSTASMRRPPARSASAASTARRGPAAAASTPLPPPSTVGGASNSPSPFPGSSSPDAAGAHHQRRRAYDDDNSPSPPPLLPPPPPPPSDAVAGGRCGGAVADAAAAARQEWARCTQLLPVGLSAVAKATRRKLFSRIERAGGLEGEGGVSLCDVVDGACDHFWGGGGTAGQRGAVAAAVSVSHALALSVLGLERGTPQPGSLSILLDERGNYPDSEADPIVDRRTFRHVLEGLRMHLQLYEVFGECPAEAVGIAQFRVTAPLLQSWGTVVSPDPRVSLREASGGLDRAPFPTFCSWAVGRGLAAVHAASPSQQPAFSNGVAAAAAAHRRRLGHYDMA